MFNRIPNSNLFFSFPITSPQPVFSQFSMGVEIVCTMEWIGDFELPQKFSKVTEIAEILLNNANNSQHCSAM